MKDFLSGAGVHVLDASTILDCVQKKSISDLGAAERVYVLHDPSDIRKPQSQQLAYIGKVQGLKKEVVNGYRSINCVAVEPHSQSVNLLCHAIYSQNHPNYVSQEALSDLSTLTEKQRELVEKGEHINGMILCTKQIKESHTLLKKEKPDRKLTHILDREFDAEAIFELIDDLEDELVVRLKLSRVSNQGQEKCTPKGKISKRLHYPKLVDKKFAHQSNYTIARLTIKNKTYHELTCLLEWEAIKIGKKSYTAVRITLKQEDKPIFPHPMLLLTNRTIENGEDAKNVYHAYIMRFKIEIVFKFLKQNLGWETFQVRDFASIKNLLALAFFLVGYFKELQETLQKHPLAQFICKIAHSKGKVTVFFLLKGLEKIAHFKEVLNYMKQENISHEQIIEILDTR